MIPTPPLLTPSGSHQNRYGWQVGRMHPTGMLSHFQIFQMFLVVIDKKVLSVTVTDYYLMSDK